MLQTTPEKPFLKHQQVGVVHKMPFIPKKVGVGHNNAFYSQIKLVQAKIL